MALFFQRTSLRAFSRKSSAPFGGHEGNLSSGVQLRKKSSLRESVSFVASRNKRKKSGAYFSVQLSMVCHQVEVERASYFRASGLFRPVMASSGFVHAVGKAFSDPIEPDSFFRAFHWAYSCSFLGLAMLGFSLLDSLGTPGTARLDLNPYRQERLTLTCCWSEGVRTAKVILGP